MPDHTARPHIDEHGLEGWLAYPEVPDGEDFTLRVMRRVAAGRRQRRLVLGCFGAAGAAFGVFGAGLLLEPLAAALADLPVIATMQAGLGLTAAIAFYGWFMNEDLSLST